MVDGLLGIDVGTTSTKAVLFDTSGRELASACSQPYHNVMPLSGWVEQDPEELWQAVLETILSVVAQSKEAVTVKALCMAAQSGSLIPADSSGNPVYPLITWLDGRAEEIVNDWKIQGYQDWVKPLSGWSLYPSLCLPTIAWLKKNNPDVFSSARIFFSVNDFLVFRLTGKMITNPSNAGGMQLVDIKTGQWSEELCQLAGIKVENLSKMAPAGVIIGEVLPEICHKTGLTAGTAVVNGGHDQGCTALGLGIIEPGKMLLACGTAWVFTGVLSSADMTSLPATLDLNFHTVPNRWTLSQSLGGLGASFEWWINKTFQAGNEGFSRSKMFTELNLEIAQTKMDPYLFFLPLTGGHDDPATTRRGGFIGLQLGHSRADMARAIMEGAAFELRWALEQVLSANIPIEKLSMVGGAAQSPLWPQILANVTGIPICLPEYDHWPALGAAILAGYGIGAFTNLIQGLEKFQKSQKEIEPEIGMASLYSRAFFDYQRICTLYR
jgi:xylulokinase